MTVPSLATLLVVVSLSAACARAQSYIGFVYPAGGQQGTTFQCTLGGQRLEGVCGVSVSGKGVEGHVVEYNKKMNPQEMQLLQEQIRELRAIPAAKRDTTTSNLITRLDGFISDYVQQPQSDSIANLVIAEITIAKDAPPGPREIRLYTHSGVSNPMVFHVGQLPEVTAEPLPTSPKQILGKEGQSLRKRKREAGKEGGMMMGMEMSMSMAGPGAQSDVDDDEVFIKIPCTVNGQISSGSVDRFRFVARRGQRLVVTVNARTLVPYMADAVPGWFQPVLILCDAQGKELAYNDDYRFKPDPVIFCQIPTDGEYILAIHDSIFRGREDFVYRMSIGELPFITSAFPLGGQLGIEAAVDIKGIHLAENQLMAQTKNVAPGIYELSARGKGGMLSNPIPFAVDTLPDGLEREPNHGEKGPQRISTPIIINGTIGTPGDQDNFQFAGRAGQEIVAEVMARRLDSPLDSMLRLLDPSGKCIASNDDQEDIGSGLNTHHADSYLRVTLPADGNYTLVLSDAQQKGGEAYAYRLRVSPPQPGFDLRVVPSRIAMKSKESATVTVHAIRKDGFTGPIRFQIKDAECGFTVQGNPVLSGTQTVMRVTIKTSLAETDEPLPIMIQGVSTNGTETLVRDAVPAEDCMQAFLWRHLVPAQELAAFVYPPSAAPKGFKRRKRLEKK